MEGGGCGRGGVRGLGTPLGACKTVGMATEYASVVASCAITSTCRAASTWVCWASQESDDDRKWTLVCTVPQFSQLLYRYKPKSISDSEESDNSESDKPSAMSAETQRGPMFDMCVCSVYYQPNPSRRRWTVSRPPAGCVPGSVGNPFDRAWPPTTSGDLQPIFSCVDSRGTHPLCVYVREYGMWCVRGYVLGEGGVNASSSIRRNSKLER